MRGNALTVMAKAPVAGQVKTRLQPPFSGAEAAEVARALLVDQLNHLSRFSVADLYLAFTPVQAETQMRGLAPQAFRLFPQQEGDLGARMSAVFEQLFAAGYQQVVIVGSDLLPLPLEWLERGYAFLHSNSKRAVLGPARDGGYYLVGANRPVPEIFQGIHWSHPTVLAETTAKLVALGIEHELLPQWVDIDTAEDLRYLKTTFAPTSEGSSPHTCEVLRRLMKRLE